MPSPSTNFLQWNPGAANQENDAVYAADGQRTGGATLNAPFPSALANKLFYQVTTMVAALANALVVKGYSPQDANLTALQTVLGNLITTQDLTNGVTLGPSNGVTQALYDASAKLATDSFVVQNAAQVYRMNPTVISGTGFANFPVGFLPVGSGGKLTANSKFRVVLPFLAASGVLGAGDTLTIQILGATVQNIISFPNWPSNLESQGMLEIFGGCQNSFTSQAWSIKRFNSAFTYFQNSTSVDLSSAGAVVLSFSFPSGASVLLPGCTLEIL